MKQENILLIEKFIDDSLTASEAETIYNLVSSDDEFSSELEQALDTEGVVLAAIEPSDIEGLTHTVFEAVTEIEKKGSLESRVMRRLPKRTSGKKGLKFLSVIGVAAAVLIISALVFFGIQEKEEKAVQTVTYSSLHEMLADPEAVFRTGEVIKAAGFSYTLAPAEAVDHHFTTAGGVKLYALPDEQGRFHSAQWGWRKEEDVTEKLKELLEKDTPGLITHFCLDDMYRIRGSKTRTPDGFTLSAVKGGGLEITDPDSPDRILLPGSNNTFYNLEITCPSAAPRSTKKNIFGFYSSHKTKIENCSFTGSIGIWLDIHNSDDILIRNCRFNGGGTQVRFLGMIRRPNVQYCLFENGHGVALKTERGSGGTQNALVEDCYFRNLSGDALDTAGGFKDSIVRRCIGVDCGQMMDIHTFYEKPEDLSEEIKNENILIQNCHVINSGNAFVFSTYNRTKPPTITTPEEAEEMVVQNITFKDCIIENQSGNGKTKFLLVKAAHTIRYENIRLLGNVSEKRVMNALEIPGWSPHDVEGNFTTGPTGTAIPEISFKYGPQNR